MRGLAAVLLSAFLIVTPSAASAQPATRGDDAARVAARLLGDEGVAAFDSGRYQEASEKLERAYAIAHVPTFGLWSARAMAKRGLLVEAVARYLEVTRMPIAQGDVAVQREAQDMAALERKALLSRIPMIRVVVHGAPGGEVRATLDATSIDAALIGTQIPVNPGVHEVTVRDALPPRRRVELGEGQSDTVSFDFPRAPDPETMIVGADVRLGPAVRLSSARDFTIANRFGLAFGGGAWISPLRVLTIGLAYERVGLGRETGGDDAPDFVRVTRSLKTLWADVRVNLLRAPIVRLSVLGGVGVNWQSATFTGIHSEGVGEPLLTTRCNGGARANVSFRAGLGARFTLGNGFSLTADAVVDEARLTGNLLHDCVNGAGMTTVFSARTGLAYEFDLIRAVR